MYEMLIKQPFDEFLGFTYEKIDENNIQVTLPVKDLYINSAGVIHGGVISTLADVAVSNLIEADEDGVQQAVTVDLNVSFLKPATGSRLIADASLVKQGKTLVHATCLIYNEQQELVVTAKAILYRTDLK